MKCLPAACVQTVFKIRRFFQDFKSAVEPCVDREKKGEATRLLLHVRSGRTHGTTTNTIIT